MTRATVLIPTHTHADTLSRAVASVQRQTLAPVEIVIIGDGVPERTRDIVADLQRDDPRIRFFDHPKGPRHGEIYRHAALREAQGDIICYLADDDLWLPHHLATLAAALTEADFVHTVHVDIRPGDTLYVYPSDLADPAARARMLTEVFNFFGLSVAGHTRAAYGRLPHGWRTTPPGIYTDLFMWRQFLTEPWCRAQTIWRPSVLQFPSPFRLDWSLDQRLAELDRWLGRLAEPTFDAWLTAAAMRQLGQAVAQHDAALAARDEGIAWQRGEVARRDQTILAQTEEIARTRGEVVHRDQTILTQTEEIARLDAEITHLRPMVADLRARSGHLEALGARLTNERDQLQADLAQREARLAAIYRSRLWRLADRFWRARRAVQWGRARLQAGWVGLVARLGRGRSR